MESSSDKQRVKMVVVENGPLKITGRVILKDLKRDNEESTDYVELCLCGRTRNKPFCDGSHEKPE
ncbi:MAG TPA: CDGSH iron-sulfur domain-containing protein [Bacteroidales bacterium]|nr:CDGSH iron-sulfur domain-containing protein [Bacteroidales bacterium]